MHELITRLTEKAGISNEQAAKVIDSVRDYVKEKFPMMAGAVDNLLGSDTATPATPSTPATPTANNAATTPNEGGSFLDKISDFIPGEMGQKAEDFAKQNLGGMFGDKK